MKNKFSTILCMFILYTWTCIGANDVTVRCLSCRRNPSELRGEYGGNITIKYHLNMTTFVIFRIKYNNTHEIRMNPQMVNRNSVNSTRFVVPAYVSKERDGTFSITITLRQLSVADDGAVFHYSYMDDDFRKGEGQNKLFVTGSVSPSVKTTATVTISDAETTGAPTKVVTKEIIAANENILFIVVGLLAFLIVCVVVLIIVCCCRRFRRRHTDDPRGIETQYLTIEAAQVATEVPDTKPPARSKNDEDTDESDDDADDYLQPIDGGVDNSQTHKFTNTHADDAPTLDSVAPASEDNDVAPHEYEYIDVAGLVKERESPQVTPSTSRKKFEACAVDTRGGKFAEYVQTGNAPVYKQPSSVPKFDPPEQPAAPVPGPKSSGSPQQHPVTTETPQETPSSTDVCESIEPCLATDPQSDTYAEHFELPEMPESTELPSVGPESTASSDLPVSPEYAIINRDENNNRSIYESPEVTESVYESLNPSTSPLETDIYLQLE